MSIDATLRRTALITATIVIVGVFAVLLLDYSQTRSNARLAVILSRLGLGTPIEAYVAEFGPPMYHFTDVEVMRSWGPVTDDAILAKTELYYFGYYGLPHRFVAVYADKSTRRTVIVTWKGM